MFLTKVTLTFVIISAVQCLNILGIFPYQGKSHFTVFETYLKELTKRGHNLTVISYFPLQNAPHDYKDIRLVYDNPAVEGTAPAEHSYWTIIQIGIYLVSMAVQNCDNMLANKEVQKLVKQKDKFDVVVMEHFNSDCGLGIAYKLETPVVGIMSHIFMPWHYSRFGVPANPSFVPFHFLGGGSKPTLYQRIERVMMKTYFESIYYFAQRSNQKSLAKYFEDIPPLEELARDIKFLLVYQHFILTQSLLLPQNVIEVGGYHVSESKPLTNELKKFAEDAQNGIIYISFGSMAESLNSAKLDIIVEAVKEFPQRVILKSDNSSLAIKNKLYVSNWLPQVDILGHKNVIAFFSHAGMGSTTEAIHFGVPVIAMPIFGDQPANAASIEESGLGTQIQFNDLSKDNLVAAFKKVLDPKFRERVKQVSAAWHDRPMPPLDTAIYWTEYAARHTNFTFRTPAADVPFYQYLLLDVIGVLLVVLLIILYSLKAIVSLFCVKNKHKETDKNKSSRKQKKPKRE